MVSISLTLHRSLHYAQSKRPFMGHDGKPSFFHKRDKQTSFQVVQTFYCIEWHRMRCRVVNAKRIVSISMSVGQQLQLRSFVGLSARLLISFKFRDGSDRPAASNQSQVGASVLPLWVSR